MVTVWINPHKRRGKTGKKGGDCGLKQQQQAYIIILRLVSRTTMHIKISESKESIHIHATSHFCTYSKHNIKKKLSFSPPVPFQSFMYQTENAHTSNHNQSSHVHHCVKLFPASCPVHAGTCSSTLTSNMCTEKTNRWMDAVVSEF